MPDVPPDEQIRALVDLLISIGSLRVKLSQAPAALQERNPSGEIDEDGQEVIDEALSSDRDLVAILTSISERARTADGLKALLAQPLDKFQMKALELAQGNARWMDTHFAKKAH